MKKKECHSGSRLFSVEKKMAFQFRVSKQLSGCGLDIIRCEFLWFNCWGCTAFLLLFLFRFPFYYEIKILFMLWLLLPATKVIFISMFYKNIIGFYKHSSITTYLLSLLVNLLVKSLYFMATMSRFCQVHILNFIFSSGIQHSVS